MILSDNEIEEAVSLDQIVINPFKGNCVQPASYDLHLGTTFLFFNVQTDLEGRMVDSAQPADGHMGKVTIEKDEFALIPPNGFVLATTAETVGLKNGIVGTVVGTQSMSRLGLSVEASLVNPGSEGKLTIAISNRTMNAVKVYPGMQVAQIVFQKASSESRRAYGDRGLKSKYKGEKEAKPSLSHKNFK